MKRRLFLALLTLATVVVPVATAMPCSAVGDGANTARVVIETGDDTATFCVSFDEDSISGIDALRRTGLTITTQDFGAGALTVCRINEIGCAHPTQPCFCECPDTGACRFWGYFRASGDAPWRFSQLGATETLVRDGDREGWRYDLHTSTGGNAPRATKAPCHENASFLGAVTPVATGAPGPLVAGLAMTGLGLATIAVVRRRRSAP